MMMPPISSAVLKAGTARGRCLKCGNRPTISPRRYVVAIAVKYDEMSYIYCWADIGDANLFIAMKVKDIRSSREISLYLLSMSNGRDAALKATMVNDGKGSAIECAVKVRENAAASSASGHAGLNISLNVPSSSPRHRPLAAAYIRIISRKISLFQTSMPSVA